MDDAEGRNACIPTAKRPSGNNPWGVIDSSVPVQSSPEQLPPTVPAGSIVRDFVLTTDLPESISITPAELDILEIHFGEFIRSMLAGKPTDDPGTQ
jgi:hypothetical protein